MKKTTATLHLFLLYQIVNHFFPLVEPNPTSPTTTQRQLSEEIINNGAPIPAPTSPPTPAPTSPPTPAPTSPPISAPTSSTTSAPTRATAPAPTPERGLTEEYVRNLQILISPFMLTELGTLMGAAEDLESVAEILAKVNPTNIPEINEALDELGTDFGQFLLDPSIIYQFLGDEDKKNSLFKLQTLFPRFTADDIGTFLILKEKLEAVEILPGDKAILEKIYSIPLDQLIGTLAVLKELMNDEEFHLLTEVTRNLALISPANQQKLISSCTKQSIQISCIDKSKVNGKHNKTILMMGVSVFEKALLVELDNSHVEKMLNIVTGISANEKNTIIEAVMAGNLTNVMAILPNIFPNAGLTEEDVRNLQTLICPFTLTELGTIASAAEDLEAIIKVLAKVNVTNIPEINEALDELGIDFGQFLGDPTIIFQFLGDEDKKDTLIKLQTLVPRFTADDIETFLKFKEKLDAVEVLPGDKAISEKIFSIPMDQLSGAFAVLKELINDEEFHLLTEVVRSLTLTTPAGQQKLLSSCIKQSIQISCEDKSW